MDKDTIGDAWQLRCDMLAAKICIDAWYRVGGMVEGVPSNVVDTPAQLLPPGIVRKRDSLIQAGRAW